MARAVLLRILQIALGLSFFLMAGLYLGRSFVPRVFTEDPAVIAIAGRVFPILAAFIVSTLDSRLDCLMISAYQASSTAESQEIVGHGFILESTLT